MNGAITGAAFNLVGSAFDLAKLSGQSGLLAAKVLAHGMVGGLSSQASGGGFESGFMSAGFSQGIGQLLDSNGFGFSSEPQGGKFASNLAIAAIVGGTVSEIGGSSFEQGALTAAMGRLFNDFVHKQDVGSEVAQVWDDGISTKNELGQCIPYAGDSRYLGVVNVPGEGLLADYTIENAIAVARLVKFGISFGSATYGVYKDLGMLRTAVPLGSALKDDVVHRSASWMRSSKDFSIFNITGRDGNSYKLLQTLGELNGKSGRFEFILNPRTRELTHQMFVRGGSLNGVPIRP